MRVIVVLIFVVCISIVELAAHETAKPKPPPTIESYSGADYTIYGLGIYSSVVFSLDGPVYETGPRLRVGSFTAAHGTGGGSAFSGAFAPSRAQQAEDFMVGYISNHGPVWLKTYAGIAHQTSTSVLWKSYSPKARETISAKAAVESWWRIDDRVWASADISWTEARNDISIYSRLGYDLARYNDNLTLSIGAEASGNRSDLNGKKGENPTSESLRGGGLVNVRYGHHDIALSSGVSWNVNDQDAQPYVAVSYGRKF